MYNTRHSRAYRICIVTSKYYISSLRTENYDDLSIRPTDNNKSTTTAGATVEPLHRTYKKRTRNTITDRRPHGCGSPGCHIIDNIHGMYLSLILYMCTLYIYTYINIHNNTKYTILQRRRACGNNDPKSSALRTTTTRLSDMISAVMLPI